MSLGKQLVETRKKGQRTILGIFILLIVEFFGLIPLIGGYGLVVVAVTIVWTFWYMNRITEPLLELGGDTVEQSLANNTQREPDAPLGKMLVETRRKMKRLAFTLLLFLVCEFYGLGPFIGPFVFGVMIITFMVGIWFGSRITDPLTEMSGDLAEKAMSKNSNAG